MATLASPNDPTALQETDPTHSAARISQRPVEALAWQCVGTCTGLLMALRSKECIFSLRNHSHVNSLLIRNLGIGLIVTEPFKTPQRLEFGLVIARHFIASDGGGIPIVQTGCNNKLKSALQSPTGVDLRVSDHIALVPGRRILDTNPIAVQACWVDNVGTFITPTKYNLLSLESGDYPLVLAPDEGIIITNNVSMGMTGRAVIYFNLDYCEVAPGIF